MLVSVSRDKSARVWRLGNHGDGDGCTSPSLTYSNHTKAVWGVELLEGVGQVVSCDGTVHVSFVLVCKPVHLYTLRLLPQTGRIHCSVGPTQKIKLGLGTRLVH